MSDERELGKISGVRIGLDREVFLVCQIMIDFGGCTQGFGGYTLDEPDPDPDKHDRIGSAAGADYIRSILRLFDVSDIQKIVGRPVYAIRRKRIIRAIEIPAFDGGGVFDAEEHFARFYPQEASR